MRYIINAKPKMGIKYKLSTIIEYLIIAVAINVNS